MLLFRSLSFFLPLLLVCQTSAAALRGKPGALNVRSPNLQDIVTYDEHSIYVRGERILFYSGEFHPFRLPVPGLWLDIFQKIKALGYSGVSFYTDWALLEGDPGTFSAEGIFSLEPFFAAASQAGIYLLARPGPYINAEVSGGGYPGWLQRVPGLLRTNATSYLDATNLYAQSIGEIIAKAQITNGGPVILVQPENEYTNPAKGTLFPNHEYFYYVEQQFRNAGIVVPFISNDASPQGYFAPGTGLGAVDIYGHDAYPLGFDCANPYTWPDGSLPTNFHTLHEVQSPSTPYSLVEFQGGSFDPWGGPGFENCATLLNEEFERVFYKNDFSFGVTVINYYMTYGGTNWGNLGHPGGYTSYDYGAVIAENLTITREKYSEAKLLVNFLKKSPAYLTATPGNGANGSYVDTDAIDVTPLFGNGSDTAFYVIRHSTYNSLASTSYTWTVPTSDGTVTVPQLSSFSSSLTLNGRDAKMSVTDYDVADANLLYCSSDIFTWEKFPTATVLVLYGGAGETHEFALPSSLGMPTTSGAKVAFAQKGDYIVVQWQVTPSQQTVSFADFTVYLLWRNDVYNWWTLELPAAPPTSNFTSPSKSNLIVKAGYLLRSATILDGGVYLVGDVNATTSIDVIGGAPSKHAPVFFNGQKLKSTWENQGRSAVITYVPPKVSIPSLASLEWKYIDSLPEIVPGYDDSLWTVCNHTTSQNPRSLTTPTSLYASDYGYHTGSVEYRGHFTATAAGNVTLSLETQGGYAFGHSIWLNSTFAGSWVGIDADENYNASVTLPNLVSDESYVVTILIDLMGLTENGNPGDDTMKEPRGILNYALSGYPQSAITWKITGNLGGEQYIDKTRGPLNEGSLYAERQGYHLPAPPTSSWSSSTPTTGISTAGVRFYTTSFNLSLPVPEYQIPLSFVFTNSTPVSNYRSMIFVNGYQFGKYVHNIGPQDSYPVPEGILNYSGINYIAVSLWALDAIGARIEDLQLIAGLPVMSGRSAVANAPMPVWTQRAGAY